MNRKKSVIWGLAIFLTIIGIFYVTLSMQYKNQFLPKTTVNGIEVGKKTVKEANQEIKKYYREKEIRVMENKKELFTFTGKDIGVTSEFIKPLDKEIRKQNSWSWPIKQISSNHAKLIIKNLTFEDSKLETYISSLLLNQENRTKPSNAEIIKVDNQFSIQPEVKGNFLDQFRVVELLKESFKEGDSKLDLKQAYEKPGILASDKTLESKLGELQKLSELSVVYTITGSKEVVPRETLVSWLGVDEANSITVDKIGVTAYIEGLSVKYSTYEKTRNFKTSKRGVVNVPPGTYGWTLDVARESELLATDILLGENIERTPLYNGSGYSDNENEFGENYIEVDLASQHMWVYINGQRFLETDIISGKPKTPTPKGVFYVWKKDRNATLTGEDYATPVDYWLPVDWDGVGIHDSPWQSIYGGNNYITKGSHGCINTPPTVMSKIYNQVEVGIPVIIY
ncbi:Putative peptidoglycan binding domain-containing protein [Carnobacterium iners]|uniref:Putative peptidoglycan binding domain-containing protein n=1 Tax=Carnobacterium iners TaxID=1073423 RepID=A0A1X7MS43_9LACT|nr:L,D-transpeptidase family protein [Carnobacterium iners]SEL17220.1 Putative peptidoglycan binding domain-containing protein [Carnobacterium iners]SMH27525.1 Putative peptidoglycan binding domain-containing protein [Carnobacterium iners]